MGRPPRIRFKGALYHLWTRGNERRTLFHDSRDYELFQVILAEVVNKHELIVHAFCQMPNHYHLFAQTPLGNVDGAMHALNGRWAKAFRRRHGGTGHVFEHRYSHNLVDSQEYVLEVVRYIVINPVRAGLCEDAAEWRWSSHRATAGLAPRPRFLTTDWVLAQFGPANGARRRYCDFVAAGAPATTLEALLLV
jgi:REP element-mobilizing transposase RayT